MILAAPFSKILLRGFGVNKSGIFISRIFPSHLAMNGSNTMAQGRNAMGDDDQFPIIDRNRVF